MIDYKAILIASDTAIDIGENAILEEIGGRIGKFKAREKDLRDLVTRMEQQGLENSREFNQVFEAWEDVRKALVELDPPPPIEVELPDGSMLSDQREAD